MTALTSAVSSTFSTLIPMIVLVIGVPLAFYGIRKVIALFPKR